MCVSSCLSLHFSPLTWHEIHMAVILTMHREKKNLEGIGQTVLMLRSSNCPESKQIQLCKAGSAIREYMMINDNIM